MFPESEFRVLVDRQEILGKVGARMMDTSGCDGDINAGRKRGFNAGVISFYGCLVLLLSLPLQ